jgi:hypothetical protein
MQRRHSLQLIKGKQQVKHMLHMRLDAFEHLALHQGNVALTVSGVLGTPLPLDLPPLLGARLDVWLSERRWRTAACPAAADTCMHSGPRQHHASSSYHDGHWHICDASGPRGIHHHKCGRP